MKTQSKYAKKRYSGMMYGPCPKVPKWPDFVSKYPPRGYYWWGEKKEFRELVINQW